jgi:hypothetical protein
MSIMPPLDCFRVSVHTDWSLSSEYFFFYTFTVNFNVYSEVYRYPKKNFYPILGNLPRFGKHWPTDFSASELALGRKRNDIIIIMLPVSESTIRTRVTKTK